MLGKIPLFRAFHVISTKFYDCVLHIRAPWSLQSVPELQQARCKRRFSWISPVFVHWFYITPLKTFQMFSSYFTVEKTDLHSATERKRRGAMF